MAMAQKELCDACDCTFTPEPSTASGMVNGSSVAFAFEGTSFSPLDSDAESPKMYPYAQPEQSSNSSSIPPVGLSKSISLLSSQDEFTARITQVVNETLITTLLDTTSTRVTLAAALSRLLSIERAHSELKHQHAGLINQLCASTTDHDSPVTLKTDLYRARADIAELRETVMLQEGMLIAAKSEIMESTKRADLAIRKAEGLEVHVRRWVDGELRKKREEDEARRAREEERHKKRAEEEKRKRREAQAEAERRRRYAEAAATRLKQKEKEKQRAREERRHAQERDQRKAKAEKERKKKEQTRREREKQERAQREAKAEMERREEQARREREKQESARCEKERQERKKRKYDIAVRWALYEAPLADALSFNTIVWPVLTSPAGISDLTLTAIREFLFSMAHSKDKDNKQRLREAFKRWHTDKYSAVKSRVPEEEKPLIEEAFHTISVHLNDLNASVKAESTADK